MENWYALHTMPNTEYQLVASLARRNIQFYLPEIDAPRSRRHHKKKPFFPGYLFIKIDFEQVELSTIRFLPGLRRIISFDDQPLVVSEDIINYVRAILDERQQPQHPVHNFNPGDPVKIKEGPLAGLQAIFDKATTPSKRVQILLKILGQVNRVTIDVDDLEKLDPPDESDQPPKRPRRSRGRGRPAKIL